MSEDLNELKDRLKSLAEKINNENNLEDVLECVSIFISDADFQNAENVLRNYLNENENDVEAQIVLAKLLWESKRGSRKEIVDLLKKVLVNDPDNEDAKDILNDIFNTPVDDSRPEIHDKLQSGYDSLISEAYTMKDMGQLKEALTAFQNILEKQPDCIEAQTGFRETYALIVSQKSKQNLDSETQFHTGNLMKIKYQINALQIIKRAAEILIKKEDPTN